ncbi:RusA family crossover junction endodeoxyribonuclease [Glycomyces tarimensis]
MPDAFHRPIAAQFKVDVAQPKQRPRVTANGTYTPQQTLDAEEAIGWAFKTAAMKNRDERGRYPNGGRFGVAWTDDNQVDELRIRRLPGGAGPRTEVTVYRIEEA